MIIQQLTSEKLLPLIWLTALTVAVLKHRITNLSPQELWWRWCNFVHTCAEAALALKRTGEPVEHHDLVAIFGSAKQKKGLFHVLRQRS